MTNTAEHSGRKVNDILDQLRPIVKDASMASFSEDGSYGCALCAAVNKSFSFADRAHSKQIEVESFFLSPALRGICEDLIALSYISNLDAPERNTAINCLVDQALQRSVASQKEFFKSRRPWQPVVERKAPPSSTSDDLLRKISEKLGWTGKNPWPSVWHMAKFTSHTEIYSYLYSATSRLVHFTPHVLLRMGWGGTEKCNLGDETIWSFSASNFENYYSEFNRTYSLLLLVEMLNGPGKDLLAANSHILVKEMQEYLRRLIRWPELVTFEELNKENPSDILRILARSMHESKYE